MDSALLLMLLLKNSWSLTGSGYSANDIKFTTNWYSDSVIFPQITVTNSNSTRVPKEVGPRPLYFDEDTFAVNIWYRPSSNSNTSYGFVKNALFQARSEVERIIRSGSPINDLVPPITSEGMKNLYFIGWRNLTDTSTRPVLFRAEMTIKIQRYNEIDY